jgi:glycosyltransferase involved in cell wall biosynthesis
MNPKVSVIIPTYNRSKVIGRTIESVLGQTLPDFELIIVDDGSVDETRDVVNNFNDDRIRYIWQTNQERSVARNTGIAASKAPYITFLDSDDLFLPNKLADQYEMLEKFKEIDWVLGGWLETETNGRIMRIAQPWINHPMPMPRDWFFHKLTIMGANLIRRDCLVQIGCFDTNLYSTEDTDLFLRLIASGCTTKWGKSIVMKRYRHQSNSVGNAMRMRSAMMILLDKNTKDTSTLSRLGVSVDEAYSRAYLRSAFRLYVAGHFKEAKEDLEHSIEINPNLLINGYKNFLNPLVNCAIDFNIEDPIKYTQSILSNLPETLHYLKNYHKKFLAHIWAVKAFNASLDGDKVYVRKSIPKAILLDPVWIKNLGLLKIWIGAYIK